MHNPFPFKRIAEIISRHRWSICAGTISLVLANLFAFYFIKAEQYIYYWDFVNYWSKFIHLSETFSEDIVGALKILIHSVHHGGYNYLPAVFLMPFGLIGGCSRSVYILSIVNVYSLAAVFSLIIVHQRICRMCRIDSVFAPIVAIATVFLSPNFWDPILYGYPEVGGLFLINIILLLYFTSPYERQRSRRLILIALLISFLILFRRAFAYWGMGFYVSLLIVEGGGLFLKRKGRWAHFSTILSRISLQVLCSIIFLFILAPFATFFLIKTNHVDIHSAYRLSDSLFHGLAGVGKSFGLFFMALSMAGAVVGLKCQRTRKLSIFLIVQWVLIFILYSKTQDFYPHHLYILMPALYIWCALFISYLMAKIKRFQLLIVAVFAMIFLLNFIEAFTQGTFWYSRICPRLFTNIQHLPLKRNDLKEIERLLYVMERTAVNPDDRVYVLASSQGINSSILSSAPLVLHRHYDIARKIERTHDVDKRDGFPRRLLTARYVIVADPLQFHLAPRDQEVVGIPADMFLRNEGIAESFIKLPFEFRLDNDVLLYIFKKVKPFKRSHLVDLSLQLKRRYPSRPYLYQID